MTVQTSVTERPVIAKPGQVFDSAYTDITSGVVTEAVNFGQFVVKKTAGWQLPTAATDIEDFVGGVAVMDDTKPTEVGYVAGDVIQVITRGRVAVVAEGSLALGAASFIRHGGTGDAGDFATSADSGNAEEATGYRVAVAGTVPVLDVNSPAAHGA